MLEITTAKAFDELLSKPLCAVYYYTDNCGICTTLKPNVDAAFSELNIPCLQLNLMKHKALAGQQLIMGVPTLIVYQNGEEIIREGAYMQLHLLKKKLAAL